MSLVPDMSCEALRATCLIILSEGGGVHVCALSKAVLNVPSKNAFKYFSTSLTKYISVGLLYFLYENIGGRRSKVHWGNLGRNGNTPQTSTGSAHCRGLTPPPLDLSLLHIYYVPGTVQGLRRE